jgi:pimeloyl-ACP methyl ester carboxylesterase
MSAITTGGKLVHYEVLGRGRPVILLHGWVGSWRYWIPTMQLLQNKYRVYALDLFGFGDSAKDAAHYRLEQQIELLGDFIQQLGVAKAALIGHGLGAVVAAEFARRNADKVPRLLIASAPLFDPGDLEHRAPPGQSARPSGAAVPAARSGTTSVLNATSAIRAAMAEAARARGVASDAPQRPDFMPNPASRYNPLQPLLNHAPDSLLARCFRRNEANFEKLSVDVAKIDPPALPKSAEGFDAGRFLDTLRLLTMPVVVIHGGDDPLIAQPGEEVLNYVTLDKENALLPILLPNVRHFPMLEDDRFARLANEFLDVADLSKLEVKERWRRRTR